MKNKEVDLNKVKSVLNIVEKMLEDVDTNSSKYNILLFLKSYSYFLMKKNEESLSMCDTLLDNCYKVNFNRSIVSQTHNLKTLIYMRNSEFSNMYYSIQQSLAVDQTNPETHDLFNKFKEKLLC
ncbi:MAG TPA: hypothetical protein VHO90_16815 [Bacteroidales bacterium]|nr:hypothetical protein [Bacteroidales bacterium]